MAITAPQVQAVLGFSNKTEQIEALIPLIEGQLENYVGWTDFTVIQMIGYHLNNKIGYQSESLSRHSVSFLDDYPPSITKGIRRKL
ncbi:hypothetical protein [Salipaludibacillus sp. CF4.18]|uniref:hypothetical protein n=1 Tax=Salipaludibacillus sp. CF4.18 TaxID=3373081 RepID=UPI003EE45513